MHFKHKIYKFTAIVAFMCLYAGVTLVIAQNTQAKSATVYEEKYDGEITTKQIETEIVFDQNGNIIEEKEYKKGKLDRKLVNEYNADKQKIRETEYDAKGNMVRMSEFKYTNKQKTEKLTYNPSGKLKSKKTYVYKY